MFQVYSRLIREECQRLGFKPIRHTSTSFVCNGVTFKKTSSSTKEARDICKDKDHTKKLFLQNNVDTPNWHVLNKGEYDIQIDFPVVIKPVDSSLSRDVFLDIRTPEEAKEKLDIVYRRKKRALVESFVVGEYYRIFATSKKVVSIVHYEKPFVIGDGVSNIRQLVDQKNIENFTKYADKVKETVLAKTKVSEDKLSKLGLTLDYVVPKGEKLVITDFPNRSFGSIGTELMPNVDVSDFEFAVKAVNSVPGLNSNSMDVIVDENTGKKYVLEMNGTPHLRGNLWPLEGERQPIIQEFVKISLGIE